jgi:hypothetical protein
MSYLVTMIFRDSSRELNVQDYIHSQGISDFNYYEVVVRNDHGVGRVIAIHTSNHRITILRYYTIRGIQLISYKVLKSASHKFIELNLSEYCQRLRFLAERPHQNVIEFANIDHLIQDKIHQYEMTINPIVDMVKLNAIRYILHGKGSLEMNIDKNRISDIVNEIENLKKIQKLREGSIK